jgi:hypothetical protein
MMHQIQQALEVASATLTDKEVNAFLPEGTPELLTTNELAQLERTAPQTIRKNLCTRGHHHGLTPIRLPNGQLRWPSADFVAMLKGGVR